MENFKLIMEHEDAQLPVYLYKLDKADRDGVICFVYYRGTRYNWTTIEGGITDFNRIVSNRKISLFGGN